jgi:hypothetical protein
MTRSVSKESNQLWKENILKQRDSGLSIASWCRQNGVVVHVFYYWQNKLFPKAPFNRSAFSEISQGKEALKTGVVVEYEGFNIHLSQYFDPSVLRRCLEVLKKC